jgi:hypothetical protein
MYVGIVTIHRYYDFYVYHSVVNRIFDHLQECVFSAGGLLTPKIEPESTPELHQALPDLGDCFEADFRAEIKSELEEVNISPVISMAVEQVQRDIDTTCQILGISQGKHFIFAF